MDKTRNINGTSVNIKTYDGKRVLTLSELNEIFKYDTIKFNYRMRDLKKNKKRNVLKETIHYYKVPTEVYSVYSNTNRLSPVKYGYLITEDGFKLLCGKAFDEYIKQWVLNCYYADKEKPKKQEQLIVNKETNIKPNENVKSNKDLTDVLIEYIKLQSNIIKEEQKNREIFLNKLSELIEQINPIIEKISVTDAEVYMQGNGDFKEFSKSIVEEANKVLTRNGQYSSTSDVLSSAYKKLTNVYGVVWQQSEKDFYSRYNRKPNSTLELTWWIEREPAMKNVLLNTIKEMR